MQIPSEYKEAEKEKATLQTVTIKDTDKFDGYASFANLEYLKDDYKAKAKYVKYLEKLVRGSQELRDYLSFLKENAEMNDCAIFAGVTREDCRIEIHHFPFSLFDITRIVLDDALANNEDVSSFTIVGRVVLEHFLGHVGLIPLSLTAHELAHSGSITLSLKNVTGDWQAFVKKFAYVMTKDDMERLQFLIKASASPALQESNIRKLKIVPRKIEVISAITNQKEDTNVSMDQELPSEETGEESPVDGSEIPSGIHPEVWSQSGT